MNPLRRIGVDPGLDKAKLWISEWYGDMDDLTISRIMIQNTIKSEKELLEKTIYKDASVGRQTAYHIYLKCLLFTWLQAIAGSIQPRFEVKMYFPDLELINKLGVRCAGTRFNIRKPQVIEKGNMDVIASYGDLISVDVYADRKSVEIGFTKPFNLLMPLVDRLVDTVIWVPFPNCGDSQAQPVINFNNNEYHAYSIEFR